MHKYSLKIISSLVAVLLFLCACSDQQLNQLYTGDGDGQKYNGDREPYAETEDSLRADGDPDLDLESAEKPSMDGDSENLESDLPGESDESDALENESEYETEAEIDSEIDIELDTESATEPLTLSVLTINLLNPLNPPSLNGDQRIRIVADFINARQPDFVTSQEVVQSAIMSNRAEMLANLTGYFWVWEMTHDVPYVFQEGISILSKWPIAWTGAVQLPHEEFGGITMGMFTRSVMGIAAEVLGYNINVFCSHMTIADDELKKADQAAAILDFMTAHPSARSGFLAGDLNAQPSTLAMRLLRGEATHNGRQGNLSDAWLLANGEDPGLTYPSDNPDKRIDYIYAVPGVERQADVLDCELVFTDPVDGVRPSDHVGILCRFLVH